MDGQDIDVAEVALQGTVIAETVPANSFRNVVYAVAAQVGDVGAFQLHRAAKERVKLARMPEARDALRDIGAFITKHIGVM